MTRCYSSRGGNLDKRSSSVYGVLLGALGAEIAGVSIFCSAFSLQQNMLMHKVEGIHDLIHSKILQRYMT